MTWSPAVNAQRAVYGRSTVLYGLSSTYQTSCAGAGSAVARSASVAWSAGVSGSRRTRRPFSGDVILTRVSAATLIVVGSASGRTDVPSELRRPALAAHAA